jgi:hypothetical protein
MGLVEALLACIRAVLRDRKALAAENLALRQQLAVLERQSKRPRLRKRDRIFWTWLARLWSDWRGLRRANEGMVLRPASGGPGSVAEFGRRLPGFGRGAKMSEGSHCRTYNGSRSGFTDHAPLVLRSSAPPR